MISDWQANRMATRLVEILQASDDDGYGCVQFHDHDSMDVLLIIANDLKRYVEQRAAATPPPEANANEQA